MRVLITGAAGRIGRALRGHLSAEKDLEITCLDRRPRGDKWVAKIDLATQVDELANALSGVDAVVHLAGNGNFKAGWSELVQPNVDAVLNLYLAAAASGTGHVVLASSIWAQASRQSDSDPVEIVPVDPGGNCYGASKLMAEQIACAFGRKGRPVSSVLRFGEVLEADWQRPSPAWDPQAAIRMSDLCHAIGASLRRPPEETRILHLSSVGTSRWLTSDLETQIGWQVPNPIMLGSA